MTQIQQAFNLAGIFVSHSSTIIEKARREMAADFALRRRRTVRTLIEQGLTVQLTREDFEYAVRVLGARRTSKRRGDRLILPSARGWALAGKRGNN